MDKEKIKSDELIKFRTFIVYAMISTIPFFTVVSSIKIIKDGGNRKTFTLFYFLKSMLTLAL